MELIEVLIAVFAAAGVITSLDAFLGRDEASLPWERHRRHERVKRNRPKHTA